MAKALTPKQKLSRLHDQGFSDAKIASALGWSKSSVGRVRRGQQSGEKIAPAVNQFFKLGKRAKETVISGAIPLPSAKPKAPAKGEVRAAVEKAVISPLMRAEGKLAVKFEGEEKVVVYVEMADGSTRVLYARGGIEAREIKGDLRGAIESQEGRQYRGKAEPWDDVVDIRVEAY